MSERDRNQAKLLAAFTALEAMVLFATFAFNRSGESSAIGVLQQASSILVPAVRFWFWRFVRPGRGAGFLGWAFAVGIAGQLTLIAAALQMANGSSGSQLFDVLFYAFAALLFAASVLFAIGLIRSRLVAGWIPWVEIVYAIVGLTGLIPHADGGIIDLLGQFNNIVAPLFWILVAASLWSRSVAPAEAA